MNSVISRINGKLPVSETEPVIHVNCILDSGNTNLSSGYNQLIIRINSVFVCCIQCQGTAAVDRQVVMSVYDTAGFIRQSFIRIARSACHAVFRAFRKRQKHLIRLVYPQAGIVRTPNIHTVQQQPYFGTFMGIYNNASVSEGSCKYIFSAFGNDKISVIKISAFAGNLPAVTAQCDNRSSGCIPLTVEVILGKVYRMRMKLGIFIDDHFDSQGSTVHKQHGDKQHESSYGNADPVNVFMR